MSFKPGHSNCQSAELSMVVIRANGKREELGTVAYFNKNPLKMVWWRINRFIKLLFKGK